ncbi:c-Myc-binding protein homolog [Ctenocephalides felis]|uniref:c-Myc-binding protein homolog n=1 Tax=Ctenocephalides felis TaxID=7515 RepID=UPI000E6E41B3|nr:c-Myc-binding protein homolog [Ctenocephalides felis]
MSNYKPVDSKREEFRKYLEQSGIMDALTRVLVELYEELEKPENALDYVRKNLGGKGGDDIDVIKAEIEAAKLRKEELMAELSNLRCLEEEEDEAVGNGAGQADDNVANAEMYY